MTTGSGAAATSRTARRNARFTPLDVDGPLPWGMLGSLPTILRDPLAFLEACIARYGDRVAFPVPRGAAVLVNDPAAVRHVLLENHAGYGKSTLQYNALSQVTGQGLLTSDGDHWRRHRKVAQPAFPPSGLPAVVTVAATAARRLGEHWAGRPGGVVDVDAAVAHAMLEVVGLTLFGVDLSADGDRIVSAVDVALRAVLVTSRSPVPAAVPTPARRRLRRSLETLDPLCRDLVARRRARGLQPDDADVLALLLQAVPESLSENEVRDEIVTLVIAGHETVASALTWALHLLAEHPQWQQQLALELDRVLARREPGWADLTRLLLTRAVVDEPVRLYPPAWVITRRAIGPDTLAGVQLPAGTLVILSPWLLHRRPDSWPDPLRFDPGRFVDSGRSAPRGDYIPFGAGPRLCIVRDFALVEAVLVLATLLQGRRVARPADAAPVQVDALVTLRPRGGLPLHLTPSGGERGGQEG